MCCDALYYTSLLYCQGVKKQCVYTIFMLLQCYIMQKQNYNP
ncbi:hypothetical protein HMPREF9137_0387 [Prevotella denticola F0289]|nr:hypothetical protein HMPREF9137_0387 [Prevotella denticola F0289]